MWLSASNGFGKSTIVEALTFALFGVSYRGGTKLDLRNSRNHPNDLPEDTDIPDVPTEVNLEFDIVERDGFTESYRVERSIYGKKDTIKFTLEKLEDGKWVKQNKRAGFGQDDFEEHILQFSSILFKNVIAMNTQETVPFFKMPADKKRALLEAIISMSLDKWKKATHTKLSDANLQFNIAKSDIEQYTSDINDMENIYKRMVEEKSVNVSLMKQKKSELERELVELHNNVAVYQKSVADLQIVIAEIDSKLSEEYNIDAKLSKLSAVVSVIPMLETARQNANDAKNAFDDAALKLAEYHADELQTEKIAKTKMLNSMIRDASLNAKLNNLNAEIKQTEVAMDEITRTGKSLVAGVPCPMCGKPSTDEDVKKHKEALGVKWKAHKSTLNNLKNQLQTVNAEIESHNAKIANLENEIELLTSKLSNADQFIADTYNPVKSEYNAASRELSRIETMISETGDNVDEIQLEIKQLTETKNGFAKLRTDRDTQMNTLSEYKSQLAVMVMQINDKNSTILDLNKSISDAESTTDDSVAEMASRIEKTKQLKTESEDKLHNASDDMKLCECVNTLCADKGGLKTMVFSMFVPEFNQAVQRNLVKAGLPFVIKFADDMSFTYEPMPGLSRSYVMLSQGQQRKVEFAIAMAFRDFVSLVGNFDVNFISLDEVIDQSTDDNAMRDMMDMVKDFVKDIGGAIVMTHRGSVIADKFDYLLEIQYDGLFSTLGDVKKL